MTGIQVKIGRFEEDYALFGTNAPEAYDRGGTFTLYECAGRRWILVPLRQIEDQRGRNLSGLHAMDEVDVDQEWIVGTLLARLTGKGE